MIEARITCDRCKESHDISQAVQHAVKFGTSVSTPEIRVHSVTLSCDGGFKDFDLCDKCKDVMLERQRRAFEEFAKEIVK